MVFRYPGAVILFFKNLMNATKEVRITIGMLNLLSLYFAEICNNLLFCFFLKRIFDPFLGGWVGLYK